MSRFAADWLCLREERDHASRHRFTEALAALRQLSAETHVVDLGAGTGSNFRYLAGSLAPVQHWLCIDNDADLLGSMRSQLEEWRARTGSALDIESVGAGLRVEGSSFTANITRRRADLANELMDIDVPAGALVTCSALLDLVSAEWLQTLVGRCRDGSSPVLFALSYSGTIACAPQHPDDALIERLVNAHQLTDKGFGPALGPAAADEAARMLRDAQYAVSRIRADWVIPPSETALQAALLDGWRVAASEIEPTASGRISAWHAERSRLLREGRSQIRVSHVDLFGSAKDQ